jgi:hypothetical protein
MFENYSYEDINEILLELLDDGRIGVSEKLSSNYIKYIGFFLKDHLDYDGFEFIEISDYVFRLKDYLDDSFSSCSVLFVKDKNKHGLGGSRTNIDLNNKNDIKKLNDSAIENLMIHIK